MKIVTLVLLELFGAVFCTRVLAQDADLDVVNSAFPVVLTPTRLRQSIADVPASVTIITAEMIRNYAIRSVPEALRLVPGMAVTQVTGNDYRINYHGTNILYPRRMNVLIDGVSVYRPAFARVDWKELPISMEDIDRIEVTRGPNSASYGANSMLAVINIISKHPEEVAGTTAKVVVGTDNSNSETLRYGGRLNDATTYRLTLERNADQGFDRITDNEKAHDSTALTKLSFSSITDLRDDETLELQAWGVTGKKEIQYVDGAQITFPDIATQDLYLNGTWRKAISSEHALKIQGNYSYHQNDQDWTTCPPTALFLPEMYALWRANPSYVRAILAGQMPSGGTPADNALAIQVLTAVAALGPRALQPTCVDTNQDLTEKRLDLELQDTYIYSKDLRMVSGFGVRQDTGNSQTYLGGKHSNLTWRVFANVEYKPIDPIILNIGGYYEKDDLTGSFFSPRVAVNYHVNENHTLRLVQSIASRMPDIQEQKADWSYFSTNYSLPINGATAGYYYQSATSPGGLKSERIKSTEVGLLSNFPRLGLLIDAKIYEDRLSDLISEKLQLSSFEPTNSNSATLRGAELQATYTPSDRWSLNFGYAYAVNHPSTQVEETQYARQSGSLSVTRLFDNGWRASFGYSGNSANTTGQTPYGREDLTLMKTFSIGGGARLTTAFTLSHLDHKVSTFLVDTNRIRESYYNNAFEGYLSMKIDF